MSKNNGKTRENCASDYCGEEIFEEYVVWDEGIQRLLCMENKSTRGLLVFKEMKRKTATSAVCAVVAVILWKNAVFHSV